MKTSDHQVNLRLELELALARQLFDQSRDEARKMLVRAMAISEVARKRVFATMPIRD
jgi:hypothetical protein